MAASRGTGGQRIEQLITAIDVGSWKVSALIAGRQEDGGLVILGTGQRESRGVRRGFIADMERTEQAIRETVEQAEKVAGTQIESVWVSFSGGSLKSEVMGVDIDIGNRRIQQADVDELLRRARAGIDPIGRELLHAQPTLYTIDRTDGVRNPVGLHANRLSVDIHVMQAEGAPLANLETCVRAAYLNVENIIAAPVATGLACLSEEERELGVALVELGAGVTNVSLFSGGMLVDLKSIPMGAADITDDIASAFGIRRSQAERMKCFYGSAMQSRRDFREMIEIAPATGAMQSSDGRKITRAELVGVITERLTRLMKEVSAALDSMGFQGPVARQVVLTGGGAEMKSIADFAQTALGRAVRIGRPRGLSALPEAHGGPAFSTLAGIALHVASKAADLRSIVPAQQIVHRTAGSFWLVWLRRLFAAFRANY